MIPHSTKYFIIIVHYGDPAPTNLLIEQIMGGNMLPTRIIVVDHGEKEFKNVFEKHQAYIRIIRPQQNNGYGAGITTALGVILGMSHKAREVQDPKASIVVCLNNDIEVGKSFLGDVHAWLIANPSPALAGPTVGGVHLFTGRASLRQETIKPSWSVMPYIHGACMIAPLKVFMDAKAFHEPFFMYWEDVMLARNAMAQGYSIAHMPLKSISHDDARMKKAATYYLVRNGVVFLEVYTAPLWRIYWRAVNRLRYWVHGNITGKKGIAQAIMDGIKRVEGKKV